MKQIIIIELLVIIACCRSFSTELLVNKISDIIDAVDLKVSRKMFKGEGVFNVKLIHR